MVQWAHSWKLLHLILLQQQTHCYRLSCRAAIYLRTVSISQLHISCSMSSRCFLVPPDRTWILFPQHKHYTINTVKEFSPVEHFHGKKNWYILHLQKAGHIMTGNYLKSRYINYVKYFSLCPWRQRQSWLWGHRPLYNKNSKRSRSHFDFLLSSGRSKIWSRSALRFAQRYLRQE